MLKTTKLFLQQQYFHYIIICILSAESFLHFAAASLSVELRKGRYKRERQHFEEGDGVKMRSMENIVEGKECITTTL